MVEVISGFKSTTNSPAVHPDPTLELFTGNLGVDGTSPDKKASHALDSDDNGPLELANRTDLFKLCLLKKTMRPETEDCNQITLIYGFR